MDLEHEEPMWAMTPDDAAELGNRRRGVESLRILVIRSGSRGLL
jgi:hypothetical protein